ncbi:hypothetical protein [Paracoccus alcaliphilus]|uniref:hypothetical protein n=1 Tax=Paracoccus alcaliphilus TaxID=34002 RepID=UPI00147ADD94|nr:hypothetical protein [Paracoccus alcaliphilus]WCR21034.1 hypothetical protein JHW40_23205 [Paracoccus alcaliphilus]
MEHPDPVYRTAEDHQESLSENAGPEEKMVAFSKGQQLASPLDSRAEKCVPGIKNAGSQFCLPSLPTSGFPLADDSLKQPPNHFGACR